MQHMHMLMLVMLHVIFRMRGMLMLLVFFWLGLVQLMPGMWIRQRLISLVEFLVLLEDWFVLQHSISPCCRRGSDRQREDQAA